MTKTTPISPKIIYNSVDRPLNCYNLFYILEKERILQRPAFTAREDATKSLPHSINTNIQAYIDLLNYFPPRPSRYHDLELPEDWFMHGKGKGKQKKNLKSPGVNFRAMTSHIALAWKSVDEEVRFFVSTIAKLVIQRRNQIRFLCSKIKQESTGLKGCEHAHGSVVYAKKNSIPTGKLKRIFCSPGGTPQGNAISTKSEHSLASNGSEVVSPYPRNQRISIYSSMTASNPTADAITCDDSRVLVASAEDNANQRSDWTSLFDSPEKALQENETELIGIGQDELDQYLLSHNWDEWEVANECRMLVGEGMRSSFKFATLTGMCQVIDPPVATQESKTVMMIPTKGNSCRTQNQSNQSDVNQAFRRSYLDGYDVHSLNAANQRDKANVILHESNHNQPSRRASSDGYNVYSTTKAAPLYGFYPDDQTVATGCIDQLKHSDFSPTLRRPVSLYGHDTYSFQAYPLSVLYPDNQNDEFHRRDQSKYSDVGERFRPVSSNDFDMHSYNAARMSGFYDGILCQRYAQRGSSFKSTSLNERPQAAQHQSATASTRTRSEILEPKIIRDRANHSDGIRLAVAKSTFGFAELTGFCQESKGHTGPGSRFG